MWLLFLVIAVCQAYQHHKLLPGNYVLDVVAKCNPSPTGMMEVGLITDLNVAVTALCKNNYTLDVDSFDNVHFWFYPSFDGDSNTSCVFNKIQGASHYTLLLQAQWGEPETKIRPVVEQYLVTCGYGNYGDNISDIERIGDSIVAPIEIQSHQGTKSTSAISLRMVSVLGEDITGKIPRGRLVKLQGHSDGAGGEQGLTAVSCDAVGDNGLKYAILRAGCGDGIVFGKNEGFLTQGLDVSSPYFSVFNVKDSSLMKFHCNFTVCTDNCDGSSCRNLNARRRSAGESEDEGNLSAVLELQMPADIRNSSDVPNWQLPFILLTVVTALLSLLAGIVFFIYRRRSASALYVL